MWIPKPPLISFFASIVATTIPDKVVVGERRVAHVGRDQDLAVPGALDRILRRRRGGLVRGSSR